MGRHAAWAPWGTQDARHHRPHTERAEGLQRSSLLPEFEFALVQRGVLRWDAGDLDGAVEDLRRAIELDSDDPDNYWSNTHAWSLSFGLTWGIW